MRVRGNVMPESIVLAPYWPTPGHVELRLRENVREVSEIDETTGNEIKMYEYDEYTFTMEDRDGLKDEVEANLEDWLTTGRSLEVNENASAIQEMKENMANMHTLDEAAEMITREVSA